jgi:histidyl-tRNA synthetase
MKVPSVKGINDILPSTAGGEAEAYQFVEATCKKIMEDFGFSEIRIPTFEYTELFARGIGTSTDIVEKEMYTFEDRDRKKITLRPEGTASVVRALIEHNLTAITSMPKLYYIGAMYRHERPQAGRYRQFHQIGVEVFGSSSPDIDVEILSLLHLIFERLNISDLELQINSLGDDQCRPNYRKALKQFLKDRLHRLCDNCRRRYTSNPLRVLDCQQKQCRSETEDAPLSLDYLCQACLSHFLHVKNGLNQLKIPYRINGRLVRGLDYYIRTAFEMVSPHLGAQNAVAAGGRYDGLVETLGGPSIPGIGFAMGLERVVAVMEKSGFSTPKPHLFIATLGPEAKALTAYGLYRLRQKGVRTETDYENSSLKSQMRRADKLGARYVLIIGENEIKQGRATLRDMLRKDQKDIELSIWIKSLVNLLLPSSSSS